jgi:hypothetical protein
MIDVLPGPGEQVPLNPQTLATTRVWNAETDEEQEEVEPSRTIYGEVEALGPFTAADAADGKWIRIQSLSGIPYVLLPSRLWARSSTLPIKKGDTIGVHGQVRWERGRTFLYADTIEVF